MFDNDVFTIAIVYAATFGPVVPLILQRFLFSYKHWVIPVYLFGVTITAVGWEIAWTFGILDGAPVNARRNSELLKTFLPQEWNWLFNSMSDGTVTLIGILILRLRRKEPLSKFIAADAIVLATWFNFQHILVSTLVYKEQLRAGRLSLAPFAPIHSTWNPVATLGEIEITIELPWVFMSFLWYPGAIIVYKFFKQQSIDLDEINRNDELIRFSDSINIRSNDECKEKLDPLGEVKNKGTDPQDIQMKEI
mmetsp:Transcript_15978/g.39401  ORF Transcript_15978/g.39401 Transcript_15978/m.39401 type:complete len:250 (-) Transcript_15978:223-972(-)